MVRLRRFLASMMVMIAISMTLGCNVSISISPANSVTDEEVPQSDAMQNPEASISEVPLPEVVEGDPEVEDSTEKGLRIEKHSEEFMLLINQTAALFPLAEYRLVNDRGDFDDTDWGIDELNSGACIVFWKQKGNTQPPNDPGCQVVGNIPVGTPVFWGKPIDVYYSGVQIGTCGEYQNTCLILSHE